MAVDTGLMPVKLADLKTADVASLRTYLVKLLCQVAYQEGDFLLSSGQRANYYINGKQVTLHPQGALMVGRLLLEALPTHIEAVAGLTLGADPMVTAVSLVGAFSDRLIYPLIVRKEAKGHGTQAYIEGLPLPEGEAVAVLEDVVTTGQSAWLAVERLRAVGYRVEHVLALVDRQQGGHEFYASKGLNFTAIYTIADLRACWADLQAE